MACLEAMGVGRMADLPRSGAGWYIVYLLLALFVAWWLTTTFGGWGLLFLILAVLGYIIGVLALGSHRRLMDTIRGAN